MAWLCDAASWRLARNQPGVEERSEDTPGNTSHPPNDPGRVAELLPRNRGLARLRRANVVSFVVRGYRFARFAQPPANLWQPSGLQLSVELKHCAITCRPCGMKYS